MRKFFVLVASMVLGCAATQVPPQQAVIPPGKGELVLDAGGIEALDFVVYFQDTGREVARIYGLRTYLDPGTYKIVVKTDLEDEIEIEDVQIAVGQERHVRVPVGRFMVNVFGAGAQERGGTRRVQIPFLVYDYGMHKVLGRGMSSLQVQHFVAREGMYMVRITPMITSAQGVTTVHDIIRPVEVRFGTVYPLTIDLSTLVPTQPGQEEQRRYPGR